MTVIFTKDGPNPVYIVQYVDDVLIEREHYGLRKAQWDVEKLLETMDLGPCTLFFGMNVNRFGNQLMLLQPAYAESLMKEVCMRTAK